MSSRRIWRAGQTNSRQNNLTLKKAPNIFCGCFDFRVSAPERKSAVVPRLFFETSWKESLWVVVDGSLKSTASTSFGDLLFEGEREEWERHLREEREWESGTAGQEIGREGKKETNGSLRSSFGSRDRGHKKFGHNNGLENHYSLKGPTLTFESCWTQETMLLASWEKNKDRTSTKTSHFKSSPSSSSGAETVPRISNLWWSRSCHNLSRCCS